MNQTEKGMRQFADAIRDTGPLSDPLRRIVRAFERPRSEGYEAVEQSGLPSLSRYSMSADEMLERFDGMISGERDHMWYVGLDPKKETKDAERIRIHSISKEKIVNAVNSKLASLGRDASEYTMTVAETYKHEYGGSVAIQKNGVIHAEFVRGNPGVVSQGIADIHEMYRVFRNEYSSKFRYAMGKDSSSEVEFDEQAKQSFLKTMKCIPRKGREYEPGYYEFVIVDKEGNGYLQPFFIDYNPEKALT